MTAAPAVDTAAPAGYALEVTDLVVSYGPVPAVRGVSLRVPAGSLYGIIGRNGAGKSTLLRCVAGLEPAVSGTVVTGAGNLTALAAEDRVRRGIALVPEGRSIFRKLSVHENLAMGAFHRKRSRSEIDADIESVTSHFPVLRERLRQRAGTLSGGQQQMLAIARALMAKPRLLLVDEPSLGLAPIIVESLYGLMAGLRDGDMTVVVVEQHVQMLLDYAAEICVLEKGLVALQGPSATLAASPELLAAYLGESPVADALEAPEPAAAAPAGQDVATDRAPAAPAARRPRRPRAPGDGRSATPPRATRSRSRSKT